MPLENDGNSEPPSEGPKITMPPEKRSFIEAKLSEYEVRLARYKSEAESPVLVKLRSVPYMAPEMFGPERDGNMPSEREIGSVYKIALAKELLAHGEVDTFELSRRLSAEHGGFNAGRFNNACAVMKEYCDSKIQ